MSRLSVQSVTRQWLNELQIGNPSGTHAPTAWTDWIDAGNGRDDHGANR